MIAGLRKCLKVGMFEFGSVVRAMDRPSRKTVVDLVVVCRCIKLNCFQITDGDEEFTSLSNGEENVRIHQKKRT